MKICPVWYDIDNDTDEAMEGEGWGQCTCPESGISRALGPPNRLSQPHLLFLGHTWLVNDNQLVITNWKKIKTFKLT